MDTMHGQHPGPKAAFALMALLVLGPGCAKATFVPVADSGADRGDDRDARDALAPGDAADGTKVDSGPDARATCTAPLVLGCAISDAGPCDPVCQAGGCDWCAQKCSYVYAPGGEVVAGCTSKGTAAFPQGCSVTAAGSPQQSDDCDLSNVCLTPVIGDDLAYCFALCRSQADCPYGVACGQRKLSAAGGLIGVCDPPYDQCGADGTCCDPLANSGCAPDRFCLLVSPDPGTKHSRTVCEFSYGDGRNGSPCASARDCQIGNTCVNGGCQRVCGSQPTCASGSTCIPLGSEFGYCS